MEMAELELLTRSELAKKLKVSPSAIIKWQRQGLPKEQIKRCVRYDWAQVLAWFQEKAK